MKSFIYNKKGQKRQVERLEEEEGRDRAKEPCREKKHISALTLTAQKSPGHEVFTRWLIKYECHVRIVRLILVSLLLALSYAMSSQSSQLQHNGHSIKNRENLTETHFSFLHFQCFWVNNIAIIIGITSQSVKENVN